MIRSLGLALAAALSISGPVQAQTTVAQPDPVNCTLSGLSQRQLLELFRFARLAELDSRDPGDNSISVHGPRRDQCATAGNWRPAQRNTAAYLVGYEITARALESDLAGLGLPPQQIHQFVSAIPLDSTTRVQIGFGNYTPGARNPRIQPELDRMNTVLLRPAEQRIGRAFTQREQRTLTRAIYNRLLTKMYLNRFFMEGNASRLPYLFGDEQLIPALRANVPTIAPRVLGKEDRAALKRLAGEYRAGPATRTAARLEALTDLARSGDREAMLMLRDLLMLGPPADVAAHYDDLGIYNSLLRRLSTAMAAQWTAQIWTLHGYKEAGRPIVNECIKGLYGAVSKDKANGVATLMGSGGVLVPVNANGEEMGSSWSVCAFELIAKYAYRREGNKLVRIAQPGERILAWYGRGESRNQLADFVIVGARFDTAGNADTEARFQAYLLARGQGDYLNQRGEDKLLTANAELESAFYRQYAQDTGRGHLIELAEAGKRAELQAAFAANERRREGIWDAAVAKFRSAPNSPLAEDELRAVALGLGLEYYTRFKAIVPDQPLASGGARQVITGFGSPQVSVRAYDSNGNYVGSSQTSAFWASVLKMTSGAAN